MTRQIANSSPRLHDPVLLTYIIPFRPRSTAENWRLVSHLCVNTIISCLNNKRNNISVIVVGHEPPQNFEQVRDTRLKYITADWAPPEYSRFGPDGMQDKWKKVQKGLVYASRLKPEYVMIVDSDDLVSRRIPDYLSEQMPENGLIINNGYYYEYGHYIAVKQIGNFNCGTNAILNARKIRLPRSEGEEDLKQCIGLTTGHMMIEERMADLGMPLEPVPFCAAVYLSHKEQHSHAVGMKPRWAAFRRYISSARHIAFFGKAKREEFWGGESGSIRRDVPEDTRAATL